MEKKYIQSVVERAYAFVEEMFGLRNADKIALAELGPAITAQRPSSENAFCWTYRLIPKIRS
jgi:hypothetical protein